LLFIEYAFTKYGRIQDTKKPYLDAMVKNFRDGETIGLDTLLATTTAVLNQLSNVFLQRDELLANQAGIPIYYLCVQSAIEAEQTQLVSRDRIVEFYTTLAANRANAEANLGSANYRLLEYERMTQQGTNDSTSIRERAAILCEFLGIAPNLKVTSVERVH
jgi:hypothetical protein